MGLFHALLQSTKCYPCDQEERERMPSRGAGSCTNSQLLSGNKKVGEKKSNQISLEYTPGLAKGFKTFLISSFIENKRRGAYSVISQTQQLLNLGQDQIPLQLWGCSWKCIK